MTLTERDGRFWFMGRSIPLSLAYESTDGAPLSEAQVSAILHCGPGFARPKVRTVTFASREAALSAAAAAAPSAAEKLTAFALGADVNPGLARDL
jgi:hypothetical protein